MGDRKSVQVGNWTFGARPGLWVLLALGLLTPLLITFLWGNTPVDQAYQQFQHAQNLALGTPFRWEIVSPLFTALLVPVTQHGPAGLLPAVASGLDVLGWMLAIATWFFVGLTLSQPTFSAASVLLLAIQPLQPHLLGLESGLTFGLFGLATLFAARGKTGAALVTLALVVLTQPPMLGFAIPLLAFMRAWKRNSPSLGHIALLLIAGSASYVLFVALIQIVQENAADAIGHESWHMWAPLLVAAQLLIATGFAHVVPNMDWLIRPLSDRRALQRGIATLGLIALVAWQGRALLQQWRLRPIVRRSLYGDIAGWLKTHSLPGETVGTAEWGLLGYLSNRSALELPETDDAYTLLVAISEMRPDYCVALDDLVWNRVQKDPWFQEHYQQTFQLADPHDSASPLTVFQYAPSPYDMGSIVNINAAFTGDGKEWIELLGHRVQGFRIARDTPLHLTLYWRAATQINQSLVAVLRLVDPASGAVWAKTENVTPGGLATEFWNAGSQLTDHYALPVPSDLAPGEYVVDVALVAPDDSMPIPAGLQGDVLQRSPVALTDVFLPPTVTTAPARPDQPVDFAFGDKVELVGFDAPIWVTPGETFPVALYWHALASVPTNYKVFVHVLTPDGQLLAQDDGLPVNWSYPTTQWQPGEFIRDEHILTLEPSAPRGDTILSIGIYDADSGQRAVVRDATGREDPEKRAILKQIKVR